MSWKRFFKFKLSKPSISEVMLLIAVLVAIVFKFKDSRSFKNIFIDKPESDFYQNDHFDARKHYIEHGGGRSIIPSETNKELK